MANRERSREHAYSELRKGHSESAIQIMTQYHGGLLQPKTQAIQHLCRYSLGAAIRRVSRLEALRDGPLEGIEKHFSEQMLRDLTVFVRDSEAEVFDHAALMYFEQNFGEKFWEN